MTPAASLVALRAILPALDGLVLPPPPVLDLSSDLTNPPQPVGPAAVPGKVKFVSTVRKEIEYLERVLASRPPTPTSDEDGDLDDTERPGRKQETATNAPHLLSLFKSLQAAPAPITGLNQTFALPPLTAAGLSALRPTGRPNGSRTKLRDIKVNLVCDGGRRWIKVLSGLTVSKLGFELGEDDSYNSDGSYASECSACSSSSSIAALRQSAHYNPKHSKTTLHKTAHALLAAAQAGSPLLPPPEHIELQLPRFTKDALGRLPAEHRAQVERAVDEVRSLRGVHVTFPAACNGSSAPSPSSLDLLAHERPPLRATRNVVFDLSLIIALISGIAHMRLPSPENGPEGVFLPLVRQYKKDGSLRSEEERKQAMLGGNDNARALTLQLGVEMEHPLVEELVAGLAVCASWPEGDTDVVCWATEESKARLEMIVRKLASEDELRRGTTLWAAPGESALERTARTDAWWAGSRYAGRITPLHRALCAVRVLPNSTHAHPYAVLTAPYARSWSTGAAEHAFNELHVLLSHLLRPGASKLSPSLTPHTLRTLGEAVSRRWTTITTNRASLCRLWKYWEEEGHDPALGTASARTVDGEATTAVAWVLEPRSLAESMRITSS